MLSDLIKEELAPEKTVDQNQGEKPLDLENMEEIVISNYDDECAHGSEFYSTYNEYGGSD